MVYVTWLSEPAVGGTYKLEASPQTLSIQVRADYQGQETLEPPQHFLGNILAMIERSPIGGHNRDQDADGNDIRQNKTQSRGPHPAGWFGRVVTTSLRMHLQVTGIS